MNGKIILAFIFGGAIGAAGAWFGSKKYYEKIMDRDIAEVKAHYTVPKDEPKKEEDGGEEKQDIMHPPIEEDPEAEHVNIFDKPVKQVNAKVIPPDQFDLIDNYMLETWTYWNGGVITNEDGNVVSSPEDYIPADIGLHFGEYEDDVVYVRNDDLMVYYSIFYDEDSYDENAI